MHLNPFKIQSGDKTLNYTAAQRISASLTEYLMDLATCSAYCTAHTWPEHDMSITHHYWPRSSAAGPAPWSSGQIDEQTARRLGPVSWTPLEWTHTHTEAHTHQSHCKRIISASGKTSKSVLIISYSGLGGFLHYNTGSATLPLLRHIISNLILLPEHHQSLTHRYIRSNVW